MFTDMCVVGQGFEPFGWVRSGDVVYYYDFLGGLPVCSFEVEVYYV